MSNNTSLESVISSDILESQFGPTYVSVIYQDDNYRVISTRVKESDKMLELSLVEFIDSGASAFPELHQEVLSGGSMGKVFRSADVDFVRKTDALYLAILPEVFHDKFRDKGPINVVDVTILVGPDKTPYAHILETYSPEVVWAVKTTSPTPGQMTKIKRLAEFIEPVL